MLIIIMYIAVDLDGDIEMVWGLADKRRKQRVKTKSSDFNALYGQPDKSSNFGNKSAPKQDSLSGNSIIIPELTDSEDDHDFSDLLPTKRKIDTVSNKKESITTRRKKNVSTITNFR